MKKLFLFSLAVVIGFTAAAQDEIVITGTKKLTKQQVPDVVVSKLQEKFPNGQAVEYFQVPKGGVTQQGWAVTEQDNFAPDETVDYYTIKFKQDNMKYFGLFKADGTLVRSKMEETNASLPDAVKTAITNLGSSHPGYKVVSKTHYKNIDHEQNNEYYEVVATNGSTKKKVYFSPDGTVLKVKG